MTKMREKYSLERMKGSKNGFSKGKDRMDKGGSAVDSLLISIQTRCKSNSSRRNTANKSSNSKTVHLCQLQFRFRDKLRSLEPRRTRKLPHLIPLQLLQKRLHQQLINRSSSELDQELVLALQIKPFNSPILFDLLDVATLEIVRENDYRLMHRVKSEMVE